MSLGLELLGIGTGEDRFEELRDFVATCLSSSDTFFSLPAVADPKMEKDRLTFPSAIPSGTVVNDLVACRLFESRTRRRAVIVLPHWNSTVANYEHMGKWLCRLGLTTVYMSLPYHDERCPSGGEGGDGLVSANLGRTIRSCRQAVVDARAMVAWLWTRGYRRIGILGSSIGSSLASIVAAHEPRVSVLAQLLTASDFGEVVWTGRATQHIRRALESRLTLEQVNTAWSVLSPISYVERLRKRNIPVLVVAGRADRVFLPYLTERLLQRYHEVGVRHEHVWYSCGHYTLADFPWNVLTLARLVTFLHRHL
jgi:dienelactone hydrolase